MNILIVEDEPEMARLLMAGLREESYEVSLAKDGCAALETFCIESFDIILLDLMLPKWTGSRWPVVAPKRAGNAGA